MDTYLYAPSIVLFIQYSLIFQRCPLYMEPQNLTGVSEFLLLGLSGYPDPQPLLFGLFLSMYLVTVLGKLLIILAVTFDPHLHTPIYFFLSNLSLADISFNTTTVPKILVNLQTQQIHHLCRLPSWGDRLFSFCMFGESPSDSDAYDQLVAICHPLYYLFIMNPRLCGFLVLVSFSIRLLNSQLHYLMMSELTSVQKWKCLISSVTLLNSSILPVLKTPSISY